MFLYVNIAYGILSIYVDKILLLHSYPLYVSRDDYRYVIIERTLTQCRQINSFINGPVNINSRVVTRSFSSCTPSYSQSKNIKTDKNKNYNPFPQFENVIMTH